MSPPCGAVRPSEGKLDGRVFSHCRDPCPPALDLAVPRPPGLSLVSWFALGRAQVPCSLGDRAGARAGQTGLPVHSQGSLGLMDEQGGWEAVRETNANQGSIDSWFCTSPFTGLT